MINARIQQWIVEWDILCWEWWLWCDNHPEQELSLFHTAEGHQGCIQLYNHSCHILLLRTLLSIPPITISEVGSTFCVRLLMSPWPKMQHRMVDITIKSHKPYPGLERRLFNGLQHDKNTTMNYNMMTSLYCF